MRGHYSFDEAKKEIGRSKNFALAKKVSIKKWKERQKYGEKALYDVTKMCGFCLVVDNIVGKRDISDRIACKKICPVNKLCNQITKDKIKRPETIIKRIRALKLRR